MKIYYIETSVSEFRSEICEYCSDLQTAKNHMKNYSNWYRPKGTGRIYELDLDVPVSDRLNNKNPRLIIDIP